MLKKSALFIIIMNLVVFNAFGEVGFTGRPITNNLAMSTGYTLHKSEFQVGIGSIGYGISENVQLGTNILLFLFQVPNAQLKISFNKSTTSAFAAGLNFFTFKLDVFDESTGFTSISPYLVYSTKMGDKTMLHLGAQYSIFSSDEDIEDADLNATTEGTSISAGLEYSISHKTKFLGEGGYDITFEGLRMGGAFLWGWEKFRLKLGVNYFKPKGFNSFTLPVIGLWWRFAG